MRTTRHRFGFSTTGKLHKIHKNQVGIRTVLGRSSYSQCGSTSLENLQNGDLDTGNYDLCKSCFKLKKKPPTSLKQILRKSEPDRLNWFERMGIPI